MRAPDDPAIALICAQLKQRIKAAGVQDWLSQKASAPSLEALLYLCRFGFFTAILSKAEIARALDMERKDLKKLVKSWYDDHREKGCGTC